jgi:hypothetical protein
MHSESERADAAAIEGALPGSSVAVEEITLPDGQTAEIAVVEQEAPKDNLEVGFNYGLLVGEMNDLKERNTALQARLDAFELATVAALETEADAIDQQSEVLADVAEEVLPPEHEGANVVNPDHQAHKPKFWESFFGGTHNHRRLP